MHCELFSIFPFPRKNPEKKHIKLVVDFKSPKVIEHSTTNLLFERACPKAYIRSFLALLHPSFQLFNFGRKKVFKIKISPVLQDWPVFSLTFFETQRRHKTFCGNQQIICIVKISVSTHFNQQNLTSTPNNIFTVGVTLLALDKQ